MNILLVGSGGREHALAWKMRQSPLCTKLYCAPGNAGISDVAERVAIKAEDVDGLVAFAVQNKIDFVVVGPEGPLVLGLADKLKAKGIAVFGPSQKAAQLEGSKGFMKDLCAKYNIPTARYGRFKDIEGAKAFVSTLKPPIVVKADGLAAGKGVIICDTPEQAIRETAEMLSGAAFGAAGLEVVIEEFLEGEEVSFFALADGTTVLPLTSAQDHKRVGDGDTGPNTGGMGAYSPAHFMTPALEKQIIEKIIEPTIRGMALDGCAFTGVLFAGLMVKDGVATLLEHNVRFGDPECQTLMMRFNGDLVNVLYAAAQGKLSEVSSEMRWSSEPALCVVIAAEGYPGTYKKNTQIKNLADAAEKSGATIFHAGTESGDNNAILSVGGRVLGITAKAPSVKEAQAKAYAAVDIIDWPEGFCRRDIAWRAL